MATATYTGEAQQLFKTIEQIKSKMGELKQISTNVQFGVKMKAGSLAGVRNDAKKGAEIISRSVVIKLQVQAQGMAEQARKMREYYSKAVKVKIEPYVTAAALRAVKDRVGNAIKGSHAEVGLRFQSGAAGKFRDTLKRMLAVLSRGSYIEARLKLASINAALAGFRGRKIELDVVVKTGSAAKIRALLELLKKLRSGAKIPIKLEIDAGTQALLKAFVKQLKAAADQASRLNARVRAASGGVQGMVNPLSRVRDLLVGMGAGLIVVAGIRKVFAGLKDALIDFPATLQVVQVGFNTLFDGNTAKAKDLMNQLKEFAIPTPFEMADLAPLAQQSIAFGLIDKKSANAGKETVALLNDIGDAAFGLGRGQAGVDRIVLALGQMHTAQKVNGQDMLQLQSVGINAWKYLAEATGKTTAQVRDLTRKGLIPADQAIQAIRAGLRRDFGGSMVAATKTLTGAISSIKDSLRVRLSDKFAAQFQQMSDYVVHLAGVISSAEFGQKLDKIGSVALNAADKIGAAWRYLGDLYTHNSGIIDAALLVVGTRLLWLSAVSRGGTLGALVSFIAITGQLSQRTDAVGQAARLATPLLYAMAAAYTVVKVAATQAAIAQGLAAASSGTVGSLGGLAAGVGKLATAFKFLKTQASIFSFISASSGPVAALSSVFAGLTASISVVALVALPLLVAALGVAAIGYQAYQEKAAFVTGANAGLEASVKNVGKAFESINEVAAINPAAAKSVADLKAEYDKLDGSLASLQNFKQFDLPKAQREIELNTKLKPLEKQVLRDELKRLQDEINDQLEAAEYKVKVEADADPMSLSNVGEAFSRTFGDIFNSFNKTFVQPAIFGAKELWYQTGQLAKAAWDGIATSFGDLKTGMASAWYSLTGGFDSEFNKMLRGMADSITGLIGTMMSAISRAWNNFKNWYNGQSSSDAEQASWGETPGYGSAWAAEQKRKSIEYRKQQAGMKSSGVKKGSFYEDVYQAANPTATQRAAQNRATVVANVPKRDSSIPRINIADKPDKKKKGKSDAEKAADKAQRAEEKAASAQARADLKREKDAANDTAKAYDQRAKAALNSAQAVEEAAKSQISKLTELRDTVRDVFGSLQAEFVSLGIINDPLGPMLRGFERLIDLGGKGNKVIADAKRRFDGFTEQGRAATQDANAQRSRAELLNGQDGNIAYNGAIVGAGGNITAQMVRDAMTIAKVPSGISACANVAGQMLHSLDVAVQSSNRVDVLEKNLLKAGAKRIKLAGARAGDTLIWDTAMSRKYGQRRSYGAGSGKHVEVYEGNGRSSGNRGGARRGNPASRGSKLYDTNAITVYQTSAMTGGRRGPGNGPMPMRVGGSGGDSTAQEFGGKAFDAQSLDGTLTKIASVNKAWGAAVKSGTDTTSRFMVQSKLATVEFQEKVAEEAKAVGQTVEQRIAWYRQLANAADVMLNRARAVDAANESIKDLVAQRANIGSENNPLAGLLREFDDGGKFADAGDKKGDVLRAQAGLSFEQIAKSTREAAQAEADRIAVLKRASVAQTAANAGTNAYEIALEEANRHFEVWRSPDIKGLLEMRDTFFELANAAREAADMMEKSGIGSKKQIAANRATANAYSAVGQKLGTQANATATGRIKTGAQVAQDARDEAARKEEEAKVLAKKAERDDFDYSAAQTKVLDNKEREIALNRSLTESERELQFARFKFVQETANALQKQNYTPADADIEANRRADATDFGSPERTAAIKSYNSEIAQTNKVIALWGDLSGMAAARWETSEGALRSLTQAQKDEHLVREAQNMGMARYAAEVESLYGQKYAMAQDVMTRQIQLARNMSAVEQQELKWKWQDAEAASRVADMTDDQRRAYEQMRPEVEKAREALRGLLAQNEKLDEQARGKEWMKNAASSFKLSMEPDEIKRAHDELEQQLEDQGFKDPLVVQMILDASDVYSNATRTLGRLRDFVSQAQGIFEQGFKAAEERGPAAFFQSIIQGAADMVTDISRRLLSAALTNLFMKAFPSVAGVMDKSANSTDALTNSTMRSAAAATGLAVAYGVATAALIAFNAAGGGASGASGVGSIAAGLAQSGHGLKFGGDLDAKSAAIGVNRVPHDGAMYRLHAGESVLTRRETEMNNAMAASPSSRGSGGQSGGGSVTVNNANTFNIRESRNARETGKQVAGALEQTMSRRSQQNAAYDRVAPGGRQR